MASYGQAKVYQESRGKRAPRWRAAFYWQGKRHSRSFGTEAKAKAAATRADETLRALRAGVLRLPERAQIGAFVFSGGQAKPESHAPASAPRTLAEVLSAYRLRGAGDRAASTVATEAIHLGHFERYLAAHDLSGCEAKALARGHVRAYQSWRLAHVGPVTINKEMATLHSVFAFALDCGWCPENPVAGVKRLKVIRSEKFRTADEIARVLSAGVHAPAEAKRIRQARILYPAEVRELLSLAKRFSIYPALCVAAYTGARRGEVARLTWADVDIRAGVLTLRSRKQSTTESMTARSVVIHPDLLAVLQRHRLRTGGVGYLFPGQQEGEPLSVQTLHTNLKRLVKGTAFEGIGWHVLRHSLASNMARGGVDQREIDALLGHTSGEMARRYRHLSPALGFPWTPNWGVGPDRDHPR